MVVSVQNVAQEELLMRISLESFRPSSRSED
jgi:hypothetical protein